MILEKCTYSFIIIPTDNHLVRLSVAQNVQRRMLCLLVINDLKQCGRSGNFLIYYTVSEVCFSGPRKSTRNSRQPVCR
jgi:hypothetical protein